jgi:hypothetical protein
MVYEQSAENNIEDLVDVIISSNKPEWDIDSKLEAIDIIENIVYRRRR